MNTTASNRDGLPESFLAQFGEHVTGFLSGFDRLRFRATLRPLFQPGGLEIYLSCCKVLIKDFSSFAEKLTDRIKEEAYGLFRKAERPIQYLRDAQTSKELLAQQVAKNNAIGPGEINMLKNTLSQLLRFGEPETLCSRIINDEDFARLNVSNKLSTDEIKSTGLAGNDGRSVGHFS